jgi:hypothetical protein
VLVVTELVIVCGGSHFGVRPADGVSPGGRSVNSGERLGAGCMRLRVALSGFYTAA